MNITVIGGGNMGSLIAANLSLANHNKITLFTGKPEYFSNRLHVADREKNIEYDSNEIIITNELKIAVQNADIIFCTLPAFMRESFVYEAAEHLKKDVLLGFVPASGGAEFMCGEILQGSAAIFGLQRAPYICRNIEYGRVCGCHSTKASISAAAVPSFETRRICALLQELFKIPCTPLNNFLEATLVPSNAILHTTRLYQMFQKYFSEKSYGKNPLFYYDWTDEASELLLMCDDELQAVCRSFKELDLKGVVSLKIHYGSETPAQLTNKLKGIAAFKNIYSPMTEYEKGKWRPDWESRYFTEDFPYGLAVIKGFAAINGISVPVMDKILQWYQNVKGEEYFSISGKAGNDIKKCGAPQRYGIGTHKEVVEFYK